MPGIEKRSFPSAITYDNKVETEAMNFTKRFQVWVFGGRDKFRDLNDVYTYTGVWLKHPQARYQRLKIDHFFADFCIPSKRHDERLALRSSNNCRPKLNLSRRWLNRTLWNQKCSNRTLALHRYRKLYHNQLFTQGGVFMLEIDLFKPFENPHLCSTICTSTQSSFCSIRPISVNKKSRRKSGSYCNNQ